ncbi:hypothetical protein BJA01nite_81200 [Bradyrhizobium japonicum]|nr:hypothetical protein BJA01nite_81200 [Bradyrhizobium japonicum]
MDAWYTRLDSKLIEVPVFGAGTAWSDGEHSQFQSLPDPRHRPQVQANGSIVIAQNTCPGQRASARSSRI